MDKLTEIERLVSIGIIQEDAESIYSLLQTEEDPYFLYGNNTILCIIYSIMPRIYGKSLCT